jgi:hypothetical protein
MLITASKAWVTKLIVNPRTAILLFIINKTVTGRGLPPYTSGVHRWPGKADNLNKSPTSIKVTPKTMRISALAINIEDLVVKKKLIAVKVPVLKTNMIKKTPMTIKPELKALK